MKALFFSLFILCNVAYANAQQVKYMQLKQEKISYPLKNFYISDVADDREDKGAIAVADGDKLEFKNGLAGSVKNYIDNNVRQNRNGEPVVMHISSLNCSITREEGQWKIEVGSCIVFYAGDKKLVEYSGKSNARTDAGPGDYIEGFMRKALANDLEKFDGWWAENKNRIATVSAVKVNVVMAKTTDKPDCIVYSLNRPLQTSDFNGVVENFGAERAATASGIGVGYSVETMNGQLVLQLTITPYFNHEQSWFKKGEQDFRVLAHEQAHFDITAIKACELANAIRNTAFTQENYAQLLAQLQRQNADASNREENTYDAETNHGIIQDKQEEWQRRITEEVKQCGCY